MQNRSMLSTQDNIVSPRNASTMLSSSRTLSNTDNQRSTSSTNDSRKRKQSVMKRTLNKLQEFKSNMFKKNKVGLEIDQVNDCIIFDIKEQKELEQQQILLNGINMLSLAELESIPLAEQEIILSQCDAPEYTKYIQQEITELSCIKKYSINERKKFLSRIYGQKSSYNSIIQRSFPYQTEILSTNDIIWICKQKKQPARFDLLDIPNESLQQYTRKLDHASSVYDKYFPLQDKIFGWALVRQLLNLSSKLRNILKKEDVNNNIYSIQSVLNGSFMELRSLYLNDNLVMEKFKCKDEQTTNQRFNLHKKNQNQKWINNISNFGYF